MKTLTFFITLFLLISSTAYSQSSKLVLIKKTRVVLRISEGDFLRFKRKDLNYYSKGLIDGIHRDYFTIGKDTTYLDNVAAIDVRGRAISGFKIRQSGIALMLAGAVLLIINAINSDKVDEEAALVSGSFIAVGLTMQFVNDDIFKIGRKKRIITMDN